jgi:hypothetical protein
LFFSSSIRSRIQALSIFLTRSDVPMAHANAVLLSFVSGVALVLGLAPGCSNNATPTPQVAMVWLVDKGQNEGCGAVNDTFTIGSTASGSTIQTVSAGATANGIPISANCTVSQNATGFEVNAYVAYGTQGTLTISGQVTATAGVKPGTQTNITGEFSDHIGLIANMSETDCTMTFPKPGMYVSPGMIWGYLSCPTESAGPGTPTPCEGTAEFLFEDCGQ